MWNINQLARAKEHGGWGVGSRLGTLNIGTGRGQEPQGWIQKLACQRLREREYLGSEREPEMNPALRLSKATCLFFAQLPRKLPPPQFYTVGLDRVKKPASISPPS